MSIRPSSSTAGVGQVGEGGLSRVRWFQNSSREGGTWKVEALSREGLERLGCPGSKVTQDKPPSVLFLRFLSLCRVGAVLIFSARLLLAWHWARYF